MVTVLIVTAIWLGLNVLACLLMYRRKQLQRQRR